MTKQVHDLVQGTEAWDLFRLTHFGASECAAMLGLSLTTTRSELLRMKKTGIAKEFGDWVQEHILNHGHVVEGNAIPHIEKIIGDDLYPVTVSDGELSASCDGLTMSEEIAAEHKQWNERIATLVVAGKVPDEHIPQCQQILMVTRAKKLIFVVSDGTPERFVYTWVLPDPEWFARIRAGWAQFSVDLAAHVPTEVIAEVVGRTPETLPALRIEVTGKVTASNLAQYREHALAVFAGINRELKTDRDFADADKVVKWCSEVESRLAAAKQHALSQTESIDKLFATIDDITAEARATRLELSKLVEARKIARKGEIVAGGVKALRDYVVSLHARTNGLMPYPSVDFGGAVKGLRTFDSMQNAIDTALANAKIAASATADRIQENLRTLDAHAEHAFLFPDAAVIVLKAPDDLTTLVKSRIADHKEKEANRIEAERERIRQEELQRIEREREEADAKARRVAEQQARDQFTLDSRAQQAIDRQKVAAAPFAKPAEPAKTVDTPPTLTLGQIGTRLGFNLTAEFLRTLGFDPAARARGAVLYHEESFDPICEALVAHVQSIQALQAA